MLIALRIRLITALVLAGLRLFVSRFWWRKRRGGVCWLTHRQGAGVSDPVVGMPPLVSLHPSAARGGRGWLPFPLCTNISKILIFWFIFAGPKPTPPPLSPAPASCTPSSWCFFFLQECMTYSVGFRAPSTRDLVTFFGDHVASTVTKADDFYRDPDLKRQEKHGK